MKLDLLKYLPKLDDCYFYGEERPGYDIKGFDNVATAEECQLICQVENLKKIKPSH